ncbi:hypothetical protein M0R45_005646 [Rubus argutus]|uniref:Uncharacterized protein n=1 Tax=Rubus argutus TaxID=59490 RepID=A0AAW1YNJ9_RUBAR
MHAIHTEILVKGKCCDLQKLCLVPRYPENLHLRFSSLHARTPRMTAGILHPYDCSEVSFAADFKCLPGTLVAYSFEKPLSYRFRSFSARDATGRLFQLKAP